jgi:hypothetical protein
MNLFDREDPDGWSEFGRDWINTSALVERMRYVQYLLMAPNNSQKQNRGNVSDPAGLIRLKLRAAEWTNPESVVDYLLTIFFPGEGKANLALDRAAAIEFLNADDAGVPGSSPFAAIDPGSTAYDTRLRSLVALLLGLPRFEEQ